MIRARSVLVPLTLAFTALAAPAAAQISIDGAEPVPTPPLAPDPSPAPLPPPTPDDVRFFTAVHYPVGTGPVGAAAGDFDGDGDLDLAVTLTAPESIRFLRNLGDGTFQVDGSLLLPDDSLPSHLATIDVDNDMDVDLAVSLAGLDQVRLFVNLGGGQFGSGPILPAGDEPRYLASRDIDRDGLQDLAVANRAEGSVTIFLNVDPDPGGFQQAFVSSTHEVGEDLREIEIKDVTDDGLPDVAVSAFGSGAIEILTNLGNGFANQISLSLGTLKPAGLAVEDFDGDGLNDVAASVTDSGVEYLVVFHATGGGQFTGPDRFDLPGAGACTLVSADFDADFDLDVATALTLANEVSVLKNDGDAAFSDARDFAVGSGPCHLVAAQLDHNASFDLVSVNEVSGDISVLLNRSLACEVLEYCQAKPTSFGTRPVITWSGTPSAEIDDFVIRLEGGTPNALAVLFYSELGRNSTPWLGGTLCVLQPLKRMDAKLASPLGSTSWAVPVFPGMAGEERQYQIWFRDPGASFNSGLTAALDVHFCP